MYTDLHLHLLPGVDDGACDPADALQMARALVALGFGAAAPSPHAGPQYASAAVCEARRNELAELHAGAENFLDEGFLDAELSGGGRHIGASRYALVETPFETVVPALGELIFRLVRKGVRPVFAHPERCAQFCEEARAGQAVQGGALLQLDLGSLTGQHGRAARKVAERLLERGLYALAATDLHQAAQAEKWIKPALAQLRRAVGEQGVERLLGANPARLLRGEEPL